MKYLIGALVVLALLFLAWWLFSRGKKQKLEQQRTEAASIRAAAEERGSAIRGQETFVQQADERAALARHEAEERARRAEESAREAQRAEEEARRHQDELERARLQHEAELRRADELDPDVEVDKNDPRPLPEDLDDHVRPLDEPADRDRSSGVGGAAATGAGAAVIGSAYAASRGDVSDEQAQRLASGVDYGHHGDEWVAGDQRSHDDAAFAENTTGGSTGRVEHGERQAHDMTHHDEDARDPDDTRGTADTPHDLDTTSDTGRDLDGTDDTRDTTRHDPAADNDDMVIINDVEDYASTEPLPAEEPSPVDRTDDSHGSDGADTFDGSRDDRHDVDATADRRSDEPTTEDTWDDDSRTADTSSEGTSTGATAMGATAAGAAATGRHSSDSDSDSDSDPDADVDSRSDANDGTDRLTERRSERVSDEDLLGGGDSRDRSEGGDASHWPDGTDRVNTDDDGDTRASDTRAPDTGSGGSESGRRTSEVDEIRDGGYGVGSAAPFGDRAQPRDHPVQAYRDSMTYVTPGSAGYDSAEPDVWFYDEDAARKAGFNRSDG
ncbi:hypothetical protein ACOCJ4_12310 [Knoellia sp. CPCC 206435]|uniref:sunset domain-containing protein n=1 Tax=Knoellia terrae TaxID=3404797 RepID=UPI003B435704